MLLFVQHNLTQLMLLSLNPPTPKKVFGFAKIPWVPFLKVGGFEPTQTHPWPRHRLALFEILNTPLVARVLSIDGSAAMLSWNRNTLRTTCKQ